MTVPGVMAVQAVLLLVVEVAILPVDSHAVPGVLRAPGV